MIAAAARPRTNVSHATRCSVARPRNASTALGAIFAPRKPPQDVAYSREESDCAQQESKYHLGVQPAIEEVSHQPANNDGGHKDEGEFHGKRKLVGEIFHFS